MIKDRFEDESWQEEKVKAAKSARRNLRKVRDQSYKIHTLSGRVFEVETPYLATRSEGKTRNRKGKKKTISASAVRTWEYGKSKPTGKRKAALVALRKLGRRDVKRLLEGMEAQE